MKPAEYRGMSDEDLNNSLREVRKHLFDLRFQSATDRLETPSEIRKARREIARIKTLQRQRQFAQPAKGIKEPESWPRRQLRPTPRRPLRRASRAGRRWAWAHAARG